ncbi:MAG: hypothetical protein EXS05_20310 [Planctomycetaceae bacterium]|nr:hypothetical protein [Planctomycetaceae bacterium]
MLSSPTGYAGPKVHVVVGKEAPKLERFTADELAGQFRKLFDAEVVIDQAIPDGGGALILVGNPFANPALKAITADWPKLSDQGHLLKSIQFKNRPALVVGGGSPVATLWAAYELGHHFGIRSFLFGDVYPNTAPEMKLDGIDIVLEPAIRVRGWQALDASLTGPESWGVDEQRRVLGQLAKLKFNHISFAVAPWQPFFAAEGAAGVLQRGNRFAVDGDTAGRGVFGGAKRFENPDFAGKASDGNLNATGTAYLTALIDAARDRGMTAELKIDPLLFPLEVAGSLSDGQALMYPELLAIQPGPKQDSSDPKLRTLVAARLRAIAEMYPKIDVLQLSLPVNRLSWSDQGRALFERLETEKKQGNAATITLDVLVDPRGSAADRDKGFNQAALLDLVQRVAIVQRVRKSRTIVGFDPRLVLAIGGDLLTPALLGSIDKVVPGAIRRCEFGPYAPSRAAKTLAQCASVSIGKSRCRPILALDTSLPENGVLPELSIIDVETVLKQVSSSGFDGLVLCNGQIGDMDLTATYISRAAFDTKLTPRQVCIDLLTPVCGEGPTDAVWKGFAAIEKATALLQTKSTRFAVPAPDMLMSLYTQQGAHGEQTLPDPVWAEARDLYLAAMNEMYRANQRSAEGGRAYTLYFARRYEFAYEYFNVLEALALAGIAKRDGKVDEQRSKLEAAVESMHAGLSALAAVARSNSDRAVIAVLNEYGYRPIKRELEGVEEAVAAETK